MERKHTLYIYMYAFCSLIYIYEYIYIYMCARGASWTTTKVASLLGFPYFFLQSRRGRWVDYPCKHATPSKRQERTNICTYISVRLHTFQKCMCVWCFLHSELLGKIFRPAIPLFPFGPGSLSLLPFVFWWVLVSASKRHIIYIYTRNQVSSLLSLLFTLPRVHTYIYIYMSGCPLGVFGLAFGAKII